jgi:iron(III) transport system substrate-binding protein
LFEAFQRRFDIKVQWKWVSLHTARSTARLVAEASSGRVSADTLAARADSLADLAGRGLVRPYDWENTFGTMLPGNDEPARRLMPELRGLGLSWFDAVYVIAWNLHFVREPDAPRRFRDFLNPKWRGRFALNVLGGAPFDVLSLGLGETATLEMARGLLGNEPILKAGTPSVGSAITTGEAHLGISAYTTAERARRNGEPQAYRFFEDYLPVLPLFVCVPEMAPHPNVARVFLAWLVTEGARLIE